MKTEPGQKKHLFTNKQLWALLVPVVVEQILNSLMGTADTMMVSNVGSEDQLLETLRDELLHWNA